MPIKLLGVVASGVVEAAGDYESIATVTVGSGGAASVTFSSIPATYAHLQVRCIARDDRGSNENSIAAYYNADSAGTNYGWHFLSGDGSSASAGDVLANSGVPLSFGIAASANITAGIFGTSVIDILDYANTNKFKTNRVLMGMDRNGGGLVRLISGLWRSTAAISTINIFPFASASFVQYSHFALYGIKAA